MAQPLTRGVEKPDTVDEEADAVEELEEDAIVIQREKTRNEDRTR